MGNRPRTKPTSRTRRKASSRARRAQDLADAERALMDARDAQAAGTWGDAFDKIRTQSQDKEPTQ